MEIKMAVKKLNWSTETNIFGTKIWLENKDKSFREVVAENLTSDPFAKSNRRLKQGYLFRNPNTEISQLASVFETVQSFEDTFNIWAEVDDKTNVVTTYVRVADKSDATMFAFSQVETFQKWSDQLDKDARKEARRKPQKIKFNKDGTVRVKVTAVSLSDDT